VSTTGFFISIIPKTILMEKTLTIPSYQWERFCAFYKRISRRFDVKLVAVKRTSTAIVTTIVYKPN
jgi:hypothetical protein